MSLPTPLAPVFVFIVPGDQAVVEPAYEAAMFAELDQMMAAIPQHDLALQWDIAVEFGILERATPTTFEDAKKMVVELLVQLGNRVPADVELGYHLCYGDAGHKHFVEPAVASKLVEVANAISAGVRREFNWIHMPVPGNRTDDAYFVPLRRLPPHPETELYLWLVHFTDGVAGTRRRIAAAQKVVADFGVATECGNVLVSDLSSFSRTNETNTTCSFLATEVASRTVTEHGKLCAPVPQQWHLFIKGK